MSAIPALNADGQLRQLSEVEADMIKLALAQNPGNVRAAARALGIGRSTLYRRMRALGLGGAK